MPGCTGARAAFAQPEWKDKAFGKATSFGFNDTRPIKEQRESLPIFPFRDDIIRGVAENKILILSAETGSGKTTQVTQYLAEAGWTSKVCICLGRAQSSGLNPKLIMPVSISVALSLFDFLIQESDKPNLQVSGQVPRINEDKLYSRMVS